MIVDVITKFLHIVTADFINLNKIVDFEEKTVASFIEFCLSFLEKFAVFYFDRNRHEAYVPEKRKMERSTLLGH